MLCRFAAALVGTGILSSCTGPGAGLPDRKKMPEFTDSGDNAMFRFYDPAQSAFSAGNSGLNTYLTKMTVQGVEMTAIGVNSPDPSMDSAIEAQFKQFKQMESTAVLFAAAWANMYHYGVVLDLTSSVGKQSGSSSFRFNYKLESPGVFSIPVLVIADNESATRVRKIEALFSELHSVKLISLSDNQSFMFK